MKYKDKYDKELKSDCKNCFGLCCIALYFSKSDGFPKDKEAGKPCINLKSNFTCSVHKNLNTKGLKGCIAYDCFGAGQKVAQITFNRKSWREDPKLNNKMFESFLVMRQLHEMLWYLNEAFYLQKDNNIKTSIGLLIDDTDDLTLLDMDSLLKIDIESHRDKVNKFLRNTSEIIRNKVCRDKNKNLSSQIKMCFGRDLRKLNLKGADFRGACLIASNLSSMNLSGADFIGADLRDANLKGANLKNSIFLTQAQINSAKGDLNTILPESIIRPNHW